MVRVTAESIDSDGNHRSLDRESITVGHVAVPVNVYRASHPTIFAGFQVNWVDGYDDATDATFVLSAGAGFGSKYATLRVEVPGHEPVYEYVDITELLNQRVAAIIDEVTATPDTPEEIDGGEVADQGSD
jgi:hypothetical protein